MIIDTKKLYENHETFFLCLITGIVIGAIILIGFGMYSIGHSAGVSEVPVTQPATVSPTPTPPQTPSPYPMTVTVEVSSTTDMPYNGFPMVSDTSGKLYDMTGAVGTHIKDIRIGATYNLYITGKYVPSYNTAETIYQVQWAQLVSQPSYYYNNGYNNGWVGYNANQVYSSTAYWDGTYYYTFQNDGKWHPAKSFDVTRGHTISEGRPDPDQIRW